MKTIRLRLISIIDRVIEKKVNQSKTRQLTLNEALLEQWVDLLSEMLDFHSNSPK